MHSGQVVREGGFCRAVSALGVGSVSAPSRVAPASPPLCTRPCAYIRPGLLFNHYCHLNPQRRRQWPALEESAFATPNEVSRSCARLPRLRALGQRRPNAALGPSASHLTHGRSLAASALAGERGSKTQSPPSPSSSPSRRPPRALFVVAALLLLFCSPLQQQDGPTARRPGSRAGRSSRPAPMKTAVVVTSPT